MKKINELIPIEENNGKKAVNARYLHAFLESKQEFANWIKNRITKYDLVENVDYVTFDNFIKREGTNLKSKTTEYALSVDAAKELSMVEGNEKGKQARRYFIECEKIVTSKTSNNTLPGNYLEALKSLVESEEQKQQLQIQNEIQSQHLRIIAPKAEYYDRTLMAKNTVSTTVIAKELGMSAVALNKKLKEMGIQYKVGSTWVLTAKYQDMGYTETSTYTETIDEETRSYISTVWTQKGREFIHNLFRTNKETTLFSSVSELKNTLQEEGDLRKRVEALGKPILNDMKQIPILLDRYKMMIAKDRLSVYERKVFLFVVVSLYDPKALAGKKMKHGLREIIGASLGFENKSTISDNLSNISNYYAHTPKFRKDTKQAYICVGGYQAN